MTASFGGYLPPRRSNPPPQENGGLYYRGALPADEGKLVVAAGAGGLALPDYQQWVEYGWKVPGNTPDSAIRYTEKLTEEIGELIDADEKHAKSPTNQTREDILLEGGDALWSVTAVASSAGLVVGTCLEQIGVKQRGDRITLGSIDMLVSEDEHSFGKLRNNDELMELARTLAVLHMIQKTVALKESSEARKLMVERNFILFGVKECAPYVGGLVLYITSLLHANGLSLSAAAAANIQKISERRQAGRIDRSDRENPEQDA